jgi:hypothetical protein
MVSVNVCMYVCMLLVCMRVRQHLCIPPSISGQGPIKTTDVECALSAYVHAYASACISSMCKDNRSVQVDGVQVDYMLQLVIFPGTGLVGGRVCDLFFKHYVLTLHLPNRPSMCINAHAHTHIRVHINMHISVHVHTRTHTRVHRNMHMSVHVHTRTHKHTLAGIGTHISTDTHK